MDFASWWGKVVARLQSNDYEPLPDPKPVDHEALDAGMDADEWAWIYFNAYEDDPTADNGQQNRS